MEMVRKFVVAVIGAASLAVSQGLIEGTAAKWVAIGIAVATAAGVYLVPNTPAAPGATGPQPLEDRP
jgi:hypothetical protein